MVEVEAGIYSVLGMVLGRRRPMIREIPIQPAQIESTHPHWLPQRHASITECVRVVRVPHSPSPFRMIGVIEGGRAAEPGSV